MSNSPSTESFEEAAEKLFAKELPAEAGPLRAQQHRRWAVELATLAEQTANKRVAAGVVEATRKVIKLALDTCPNAYVMAVEGRKGQCTCLHCRKLRDYRRQSTPPKADGKEGM